MLSQALAIHSVLFTYAQAKKGGREEFRREKANKMVLKLVATFVAEYLRCYIETS